jgi:hypothetical protein
VCVIRYYGADNPVDGVVLNVLLKKAHEIHKALGTHVPVPEESESVTEAVLNALFLRGGYQRGAQQLAFDFMTQDVTRLHRQWQRDAEREKITRARFAQRALKPEEVQRELQAADSVLGDPDAVREFVLEAAHRLGLTVQPDRKQPNCWHIPLTSLPPNLPDAIRFALPASKADRWTVSFISPTPAGAAYLGRNHPFVQALARYLLEDALTRRGAAVAARAGALATRAVQQETVLLLLRVRYLLKTPEHPPLFSEEVRVFAFQRAADGQVRWLPEEPALTLLSGAQPHANLSPQEKQAAVQAALDLYPALESDLRAHLEERARQLEEAHRRIRKAVRRRTPDLTMEPQQPPDLLGTLVLLPAGGAS